MVGGIQGRGKLKVFDIQFSDGKRCRCISMEPDPDEAVERSNVESIFHPGYVTEMRRIVAPPPEKLPWKRQAANLWSIDNGRRIFALSKLPSGEFHCFWSGGEVIGDKSSISSAVRKHWAEGV